MISPGRLIRPRVFPSLMSKFAFSLPTSSLSRKLSSNTSQCGLATCRESQKGQKIRLLVTLLSPAEGCILRRSPPSICCQTLTGKDACLLFIFSLLQEFLHCTKGTVNSVLETPFCPSSLCSAELIPGTLGQRQSNRSADMCSSPSRAVSQRKTHVDTRVKGQ